jgi:hypothetical protein
MANKWHQMMEYGRGITLRAHTVFSRIPTPGLSVLRPQKHKSPAEVAGLSARQLTKNSGSPTWARTRDNLINSQVLYQLSYRGIVP